MRLPDTYPAVPRGNDLKERPLVGFISSVRTLLILPGLGIEVITPASKFRMLLHTNPTRERGECLGTRAGASEDM